MDEKYACRNPNYSLKPVTEGSKQELYCAGCPSSPYRGPKCLHGHSPYTRQLIREVVQKRVKDAQIERNRGRFECLLCVHPVQTYGSEWHRECRAKVMARMRAAKNRGMKATLPSIIEQLVDEGDDAPPY
jgi:hypothetical protein